VKGMTVCGLEIANLKGIEVFASLTELNCNDNLLTTLDLSNNKALKYLDCSYNQLTTLNVSNCPELEDFGCVKNQLTELDLSKNLQLKKLYCGSNQLTELDLSKNRLLEIVKCGYNQLARLFLAPNTALEELECCSNRLIYLDLTTNKRLHKLVVYNNNITGTGMQTLVESLPTVENGELYVCRFETISGKTNYITSEQVNVAHGKGWEVYTYENQAWIPYGGEGDVLINEINFPDPNFRAAVSNMAIDKNSDGMLSKYELANTLHITLPFLGVTNMKGLEFFTELEALNCYGNDSLTSLDVRHNKALKVLFCSNNQLTELDLSENTALEELYCSFNQLTTLDLSNNKRLKILECDRNVIRNEGMDALINSLPTVTEGALNVYRFENFTSNKLMAEQAQAARNKGWKPKIWDGTTWQDFDGEVGVPINKANFPDPIFRAYISDSSIDRDPDGVLTDKEIGFVRYLSISSLGIANLKGIEVFSNMTSLYCHNNQLTELDLSKNPALTNICCSYNQLTELDVSMLTQLKELDCGWNQLTELDVSKNTQLKELDCGWNQLTELDLSKNTALEEVYCYHNAIRGKRVDRMIGNLPAVADVQFGFCRYEEPGTNSMTPKQVQAAKDKGWKPLLWTGTQWVDYEGDLKINETHFPDAKLRAFVARNVIDKDEDGFLTDEEIDAVTSLNVSSRGIASLDGIEIFRNLKELNCRNNNLVMLDVSRLTALKKLDCSTNQLYELDLSKNTQLEEVKCYDNRIRGEGMDTLVVSLPFVASGRLYVCCSESDAGNVVTSLQARTAKFKGWSVLRSWDAIDWTDYDGELVNATLSFDNTSVSTTYGSPFNVPTLMNPEYLDVIYSSSNTQVATVDRTTGEVTVVGGGTTFIRASFNGNNLYWPVSASYKLVVSKIMPTVQAPEPIEGLIANGEPQPLITPGTTDGGEMRYSLDGKTWSADIPTATEAGEYTVYYKVLGNNYYNSVAAEHFTVVIAQPSAISAVKGDAGNDKDAWYTTGGRRLSSRPVKGVYIHQSRKVVAK